MGEYRWDRTALGYVEHPGEHDRKLDDQQQVGGELAHRFAFTAYATGDRSLSRLAKELTTRGLTTRPTPSQPAKPVTTTGLHKILTNPYYHGVVTFRGVTYECAHQPHVDAETWLRVQTNLDANNARGERPQKYDRYLKGTLYCACGAKLMIERPRDKLEAERLKLVQAHYADAIPLGLLKSEPAERRILNRALFTRIIIDDEENATYTPEQTTASALAPTTIDAPDAVTAETKLPRHQAGRDCTFNGVTPIQEVTNEHAGRVGTAAGRDGGR